MAPKDKVSDYLTALDIASQYEAKNLKLAKEIALDIMSWAYLNSDRCPDDVLQRVSRKAMSK